MAKPMVYEETFAFQTIVKYLLLSAKTFQISPLPLPTNNSIMF